MFKMSFDIITAFDPENTNAGLILITDEKNSINITTPKKYRIVFMSTHLNKSIEKTKEKKPTGNKDTIIVISPAIFTNTPIVTVIPNSSPVLY